MGAVVGTLCLKGAVLVVDWDDLAHRHHLRDRERVGWLGCGAGAAEGLRVQPTVSQACGGGGSSNGVRHGCDIGPPPTRGRFPRHPRRGRNQPSKPGQRGRREDWPSYSSLLRTRRNTPPPTDVATAVQLPRLLPPVGVVNCGCVNSDVDIVTSTRPACVGGRQHQDHMHTQPKPRVAHVSRGQGWKGVRVGVEPDMAALAGAQVAAVCRQCGPARRGRGS